MTLVRFRRRRRQSKRQSARSLPMQNGASPPTTNHNLGSKLQRLAGKSPAHLAIVEEFVDLILNRLSDVTPDARVLSLCLMILIG